MEELFKELFPKELTTYFDIVKVETLCNISTKEEYWIIDFEEKNQIPEGYKKEEYHSKGFMESKLIQDFPLRGKAVYLRIKKRRWEEKQSGKIIKRDYGFIIEGVKFTKELSDFLKEAGGYAQRYHQEHSELLRD